MSHLERQEIQKPSDTVLTEYEESDSICLDASRRRMMESSHSVRKIKKSYNDQPLYEEIFRTSPFKKDDVARMKHTQISSFKYKSTFTISTPNRWNKEMFKRFGFQQMQNEGQGFKVGLEGILDRTIARRISDEIYKDLAGMNKY
mgnify:CR=1 FL=1